MLYFAVPLKPRRSSRDWQRTSLYFRATIRSILAQDDPNFRVVVACTDRPIAPPGDPRIEYLSVAARRHPIHPGFRDKRDRLFAIASHVRRLGGGTLMFVDADDLVSRRLAGFLNRNNGEGFVAPFGLEYDQRTRRLRLAPRFWNLCGTSIALRLPAEELPRGSYQEGSSHWMARSHHLWAQHHRCHGRRIRRFPFPPAIYRIFSGDNLSVAERGGHGWKRDWLRACTPSFAPGRRLRREFCLDREPE